MDRPTMECPFCRELIAAAALKCRYCGETISKPPVGVSVPEVEDRLPREEPLSNAPQQPDGAGVILVLGILSWCICFICGIFAWTKGNEYLAQCEQMGIKPDGAAVAGRLLGKVHMIFMICVVGIYAVIGVIMLIAGMLS